MQDFFTGLFKNKAFLVTVLAWFLAQTLKVILGFIRERRINFKWFVGTGGMPSSHVAGATALAASVGISSGFDSILFALTLIFAIVVMFDAQGVRRASGKQAEILNRMAEDIYSHRPVKEDRLIELIGHTPVEVFMGALLGIVISLICYL